MTRPAPAGDYDYEARGGGYARRRRTEPRIASLVHAALGDARTVINVGAGAGSYEPVDRYVVAVEPSASMRSQRAGVPAVDAVAEDLPFDDDSFDAGMAMITVHQWNDLEAGLRELRRVVRGPVVVLSFDDSLREFWLNDYVPGVIANDGTRMPAPERVGELLGGEVTITPVPIPNDCVDGFIEAFYARPEAFLDPEVRAAQSVWGFGEPEEISRGIDTLRADLESGAWDAKYGSLRKQPEYIGSLRMIVAHAR